MYNAAFTGMPGTSYRGPLTSSFLRSSEVRSRELLITMTGAHKCVGCCSCCSAPQLKTLDSQDYFISASPVPYTGWVCVCVGVVVRKRMHAGDDRGAYDNEEGTGLHSDTKSRRHQVSLVRM